MLYTTLFFDLDDTLYDNGNGLWEAIKGRMNQYMCERLNLPEDQVPDLRQAYFEKYGTTLRGLQIHHYVNADDYLAYVHDLPLDRFLKPDSQLQELLESLPQIKWIFTNADRDHAQRVLAILDVTDCFEGIIDVRALNFYCKPEIQAYHMAIKLAGEPDPRRCVLLDDSPGNLEPAREMDITTILVGKNGHYPAAVHTINRLYELPRVMPELWSDGQ